MGSAGMTGHVVVCGWNPSAREVIEELLADPSRRGVVLLSDTERNPADRRVYFIRGDATNEEDLERAGIRDAAAAIVFPDEPTDAADMRSILVVMAIESMAPQVRTVVEVSNARRNSPAVGFGDTLVCTRISLRGSSGRIRPSCISEVP